MEKALNGKQATRRQEQDKEGKGEAREARERHSLEGAGQQASQQRAHAQAGKPWWGVASMCGLRIPNRMKQPKLR